MIVSAEERLDVLEYHNDALEEALARFMEFTEEVIRDNRESDRKLRDEMRDFRERSEKTDEKFRKEMKDFRKRGEAADKKFREEMKTLREESEKADRELRERSEKADRELRQEINRTRGELSNRLGTLAEDMVVPGIPGIARQYFDVPGVDFLTVRARKRSSSDPSRIKEFDGIAVSGKYFFVNETKSNPKPEYAKEFVESLPEIADFFPEYADRKLIPVFSSLYIPPEVVVYLSRNGVYAMGMKDDGMDLLNFNEVEALNVKH
jgi:F0F1-type ATP synthase membrane subunit b/b'